MTIYYNNTAIHYITLHYMYLIIFTHLLFKLRDCLQLGQISERSFDTLLFLSGKLLIRVLELSSPVTWLSSAGVLS